MKKIILDTNIWYSSTIEELNEIVSNNEVILPIIVLNEIYTSPNISISEEKFNDLKNGIKNILAFKDKITFIDLNPFEYILKTIHPNIEPSLSSKFYINEFESLIQLDFEDVKNHALNREDISNLTNYINETSIRYKGEIKENKNKFKSSNTLSKTEALIIKYTNDNLEQVGNSYPKIDNLDKEKNELLLLAFDELLREISRSEMKMRDNDWVDIFILTYVSSNDLFWTKEKSKQRLINNCSLSEYLFENSYS